MRGLALPESARMGVSLEMFQRARLDGEDTLIVALTYRCNSRCRFCIIETEIDERLEETDLEVFEAVFAENARTRTFRRLTISGAEATLRRDLPDLARAAIARGGFEVVRIQTNGRRLDDEAFCRELVAAGVTEYFVSIHAHEPALDAHITRSTRSFGEMVRGLANLRDQGARIVANTVVCRDNAAHLPAIARFLRDQGIHEGQFWSFLHVGEVGQEEHLVAVGDAVGPLNEAVALLRAAGVPVTVKWFPRCLLDHGEVLDNHQPQMLIRDEFQVRLSDGFRFGCVNASRCRWFGRGCDGLHEGYVRRFGDEADRLRPRLS